MHYEGESWEVLFSVQPYNLSNALNHRSMKNGPLKDEFSDFQTALFCYNDNSIHVGKKLTMYIPSQCYFYQDNPIYLSLKVRRMTQNALFVRLL